MGNYQQEHQIHYDIVKREQHAVLGSISTVKVNFGGREQLCTMKCGPHLDVEQINQKISWLMDRQTHTSFKYLLKKIYAQNSDKGDVCSSVGQK